MSPRGSVLPRTKERPTTSLEFVLTKRIPSHSPRSFAQFPGCPEAGDPRSTYSAFALASMLDDWSAIDVDLALKFLLTCEVIAFTALPPSPFAMLTQARNCSDQKEASLSAPASSLKVIMSHCTSQKLDLTLTSPLLKAGCLTVPLPPSPSPLASPLSRTARTCCAG